MKIPAVLTGLTIGAGILLIEGSSAFEAASTWIWGIALPMSVIGVFTHFLPSMRLAWAKRRLRQEKDEYGPLLQRCNFSPWVPIRSRALRWHVWMTGA